MAKMKRQTAKKTSKKAKKPRADYSMYAIVGFNSKDESETGFLAFNAERQNHKQNAYKIVHDI